MNWKDPETWEEAAKQVADLIEKNEFLEWQMECTNKENLEQVRELMEKNEFLEKRKDFYKEQLTERSAQLVRAIRMLQDEGINFEVEEVKAKAHASGELAELLNDELNQKENDDER